MSFRDHIRSCNNYQPTRAVPLTANNTRVGLLRRDNADALRRFPEVFAVAEHEVELVARGDVAAVSRAVDAVVDALVDEGRVRSGATRHSTPLPAGVARPSFASTAVLFRSSGPAPMASISMAIFDGPTHCACGSAGAPRANRWRRTSSTTSSPAGSATGTGSRTPC